MLTDPQTMLLVEYAAIHLNVMAMKDPRNFPRDKVERATRHIRQSLHYDSACSGAMTLVMILGLLVGFLLGKI